MSPAELAGLQRALAGEHAAVFAYGVVGGGLPAAERGLARNGAAAHRVARDRLADLLRAAGAVPVGTEPGYATPRVVGNRPAALALAARVEDGLATTYDALLATGDTASIRALGVASLRQAAVQAARLRRLAGVPQPAVAFPGR